jgi:hypothetical protein
MLLLSQEESCYSAVPSNPGVFGERSANKFTARTLRAHCLSLIRQWNQESTSWLSAWSMSELFNDDISTTDVSVVQQGYTSCFTFGKSHARISSRRMDSLNQDVRASSWPVQPNARITTQRGHISPSFPDSIFFSCPILTFCFYLQK